ncbi:glutathione S-transferase [Siculibacillus lacustris]|uniref:Glutathione S-transferase n=1 Tax=Siculibacillus lacustris TaxID=1549641 RepID=A0A4Q9VS89_9HYPH|nr:glutathione S-transferase [Siculibacillus lacustris]TBW38695.1 glutathione S-transferase [Siculibacillus lacustris]
MSDYTLHCFGESGNSYKAALMLELCGLDWAPAFVPFFEGATRKTEWRETLNEMGEAPVLIHGDLTLTQSGVILDYLAEETGKFGPETAAERREIWRWILFDNHKFTSYFATLRFFLGIKKFPESPVTEFLRGRVIDAYKVVEKHLASRDFLVGGRPTIADLSLAGYCFYTEEVGFDRWATFPAVHAWTGRIAALPGWKGPWELMPSALTGPSAG